MKIKYEYVNGDVVEVEAPDEIGEFIKESLKAEHADDERHRVHTLSLEGALYEGRDYRRYDPMLRRLEKQETKKDRTRKKAQLRGSLKKGYSKLSEAQRRRISMYANGLTMREIAEKEGVYLNAVYQSISSARKIIKKFL